MIIILPTHIGAVSEKTFEEYAVKAALLERISNYIEWPQEKDPDDQSKPFIIKVIGVSPFVITRNGRNTDEDWLTILYKTQKIKNKKVEIHYISKIKDIPGCHILFVSRSMKNKLPEILEVARKYPILTVSDTEGFAKKGIDINLYIDHDSPKYEINETALKASALTVRYQLFEWGKRINPIT